MIENRTIKLKRLGKKKVKSVNFIIENPINTLNDLITECVTAEVNRYY